MIEFFALGALAISAIKCGLQNAECKQRVCTLPNGIKYYYDRRGTTRLCSNNEIIIGDCYNVWKDTHYNVIYDGRKEKADRKNEADYESEKKLRKELADKYGGDPNVYHYKKYIPSMERSVEVEASTGLPYAIYEDFQVYNATKYYKGYYEKTKHSNCILPSDYYKIVEITKDEYDKLDGIGVMDGCLIMWRIEGRECEKLPAIKSELKKAEDAERLRAEEEKERAKHIRAEFIKYCNEHNNKTKTKLVYDEATDRIHVVDTESGKMYI
jgi:hypothetical protein